MRVRQSVALLAAALLAVSFIPLPSQGALAQPPVPAPNVEAIDDVVPDDERDALLGSDWQSSDDAAVIGVGDESGFHLYRADVADGLQWSRIATLTEFGTDTDRWIGNVCVTAGATHAAVVYAPRGVVNDEWGFENAGRAAIVDLQSSTVTELGLGFSMAYFNPGCGTGSEVTFSRAADGATDIAVYDVTTLEARQVVSVEGQATSPVIARNGALVAAYGAGLVEIDATGATEELVVTAGVPYELTVTPSGEVALLEATEDVATLSIVDTETGSVASALVEAPIEELGLTRSANGDVLVLTQSGVASQGLPEGVSIVESEPGATASFSGDVLLSAPGVAQAPSGDPQDAIVTFDAEFVDASETRQFHVPAEPAVGLAEAPTMQMTVSSVHSPVDVNRACAVPRNDPNNQALQPKPRQVEWAVNMAVQGLLTNNRPANHNNWGLPSYSPQGIFPPVPLSGGGRIPAQVLLGVLAQESNLWQASRFARPGQLANPLVGNYYGHNESGSASGGAFWEVNFPAADCGYGVGQITDGMRLAGQERPGQAAALPVNQQRAIALDYAANIAMATRMLAEKWNQTRAGGLTLHNGSSQYVENWFFAIWAYNSGYYPQGAPGEPWGVGWLNNPINPIYAANRGSFLDGSPADAATPQRWPYPERVLGFAAHGFEAVERQVVGQLTHVASYRTAWWPGTSGTSGSAAFNRSEVKPPSYLFCDPAVNACNPNLAAPCTLASFQCWWNGSASWKFNCADECGREFLRFNPASMYRDEQVDGTSWPPACTRNGLPAAAVVVDDLPLATSAGSVTQAPIRDGCGAVSTSGSFGFDFGQPRNGAFPNTIDLHQLGGGINEHFYFSRQWGDPYVPSLLGGQELSPITGTWSLGQSHSNRWMRIWVHTPDHAAWTQQAKYRVDTGSGIVAERTLQQRTYANSWRELGVFLVNGVPSVSLSNRAERPASSETLNSVYPELQGVVDVAWDAVAFEPLNSAPSDVIVSMGDSYSSGEGSPGATSGRPYWAETDNLGTSWMRNACHRSDGSWVQGLEVGQSTQTLQQRGAARDPSLSFAQTACSGATTATLLEGGQHGELAQIDQGYLSANTTLVTLTIGGNDIGFGPVIQTCLVHETLMGESCVGAGDWGTAGENLADATAGRVVQAGIDIGLVLDKIDELAPNAEIIMLGYPPIFGDGGGCVGLNHSGDWLNSVGQSLESAQEAAVADAQGRGVSVTFASVSGAFDDRAVCGSQAGVTGVMPYLGVPSTSYGTSGEVPMWTGFAGIPPAGVSQQSFHPNGLGAGLMAGVGTDLIADVY